MWVFWAFVFWFKNFLYRFSTKFPHKNSKPYVFFNNLHQISTLLQLTHRICHWISINCRISIINRLQNVLLVHHSPIRLDDVVNVFIFQRLHQLKQIKQQIVVLRLLQPGDGVASYRRMLEVGTQKLQSVLDVHRRPKVEEVQCLSHFRRRLPVDTFKELC